MRRARELAADIGRRRLCWELTDHPEKPVLAAVSARATEELSNIATEIWDDNNLGNAIPGATPRAEISVRGPLPLPGLPLLARHGRPLTLRARDPQRLDAPIPRPGDYGRRLVRLGAQLVRGRTVRSSNATTNAPGCPARSNPAPHRGADHDHRPRQPGRYC
jgi:hypothetical protein